MNAVIQVLISIKELRTYFFNKEFRTIAFCQGLAKLFKEMLTLEEDYEHLKPTFFHRLIEPRFAPD